MALVKTKTKLVQSYKIKVARVDIDGNPTGELVEVGQLMNLDTDESRDMITSYVIGNDPDPGDPQEVIPGIVRTRQLTAGYVSLYSKNVIEDLGREVDISSLTQQNDPFVIQEIVVDPSGVEPTKIKQYNSCFIQSYRNVKNIAGGDVRIIENVTIVYKNVTNLTA